MPWSPTASTLLCGPSRVSSLLSLSFLHNGTAVIFWYFPTNPGRAADEKARESSYKPGAYGRAGSQRPRGKPLGPRQPPQPAPPARPPGPSAARWRLGGPRVSLPGLRLPNSATSQTSPHAEFTLASPFRGTAAPSPLPLDWAGRAGRAGPRPEVSLPQKPLRRRSEHTWAWPDREGRDRRRVGRDLWLEGGSGSRRGGTWGRDILTSNQSFSWLLVSGTTVRL